MVVVPHVTLPAVVLCSYLAIQQLVPLCCARTLQCSWHMALDCDALTTTQCPKCGLLMLFLKHSEYQPMLCCTNACVAQQEPKFARAASVTSPATPSTTTLPPTPVNCAMSDWVDVGICNTATGRKPQSRNIITLATNGGTACPTQLTQEADCRVDCVTSDWIDAGACDPRTGRKPQSRMVIVPAANGGTACPFATSSPERWTVQ